MFFCVVGLPEEQSFFMCCFHAVSVLTVRRGAPTSSPAPSAQGGSHKLRQFKPSLCSRCLTVLLQALPPHRHRVAHTSSGKLVDAQIRTSKPSGASARLASLGVADTKAWASIIRPSGVLRTCYLIREAHERAALMTHAHCVHTLTTPFPFSRQTGFRPDAQTLIFISSNQF